MARIVHLVKRPHDCIKEIQATVLTLRIWFGTIVECSCGKQFTWSEHQFEGPYWAERR